MRERRARGGRRGSKEGAKKRGGRGGEHSKGGEEG